MEKPMFKKAPPFIESSDINEDASGVFRVLEAFSDLPKTHESSQEALNRFVASFDLDPAEYGQILEETSAELNKLDKKEKQVIHEAQTSVLETVRAWANKHRMAATLLVAGALHSPIIAKSTGLVESVQNILQTVKEWEKPGSFIRPQTDTERQSVINKIHERGERVNQEAKQAYQKEQKEKLERGEDVKLNNTYLKLEELNGEDPEKVKIAEQKKQEMIDMFAKRMGDDFNEEFIKSVVNEMFGVDANYEWGQGSATEYFITGKRNCVSIARAEQMVFEALIDRLPEANRNKYQLGTAFEKQHEIAILKVLKSDGTISRTYFLQPPVDTLFGTADRPGSPTVDLATMQRAMTSEKPAKISSNTKTGDIPPSPDIDVLTNQPVSLNIDIQGELRGSDYIQQIVEEREIEIQWKEPSTTDEIPDLEIIKNDEVYKARQKIQDAFKFIADNELICSGNDHCPSEEEIKKLIPFTRIDLSFVKWKDIEPDQMQEIFSDLKRVREMHHPDTIDFGDINNLTPKAIKELASLYYPGITVSIKAKEGMVYNLENYFLLLSYYAEAQKNGEDITKYKPLLHIQLDEDADIALYTALLENLPAGNFAISQKNTIARPIFTDDEVMAMVNSKARNLFLEGADLSNEDLQNIINNPNKTYHFGLTLYLENLVRRPEIINSTHIKPWIDGLFTEAQMKEIINSLPLDKRASIIPFLEKLQRESRDKFSRAHN
jgi:hypothetical protein